MANPERGEVSITINGTVYTLSLSLNAMVALEEMFSTPEKPLTFQQISEIADKGSIRHVRAMIWSCFQDYHPDLSLPDVGKLVSQGGGLDVFTLKLAELAAAVAPDPKDLKKLGVKANPPGARAARAGTGGASTSRPAGQA